MKTASLVTGSCDCGRVRFVLTPPGYLAAHCRCESCREEDERGQHWACIPDDQLRWVEGEGAVAQLGTETRAMRHLCSHCEQTLFYQSECWPGELHVLALSLDHIESEENAAEEAEEAAESSSTNPIQHPLQEWCPRADARPSFGPNSGL